MVSTTPLVGVLAVKLQGFTLFKVPRGWQLSLREEGTDGWQVHVPFPEDKVRRILNVLGELVPDKVVVVDSLEALPPVRGKLDLRPAPHKSTRVRL